MVKPALEESGSLGFTPRLKTVRTLGIVLMVLSILFAVALAIPTGVMAFAAIDASNDPTTYADIANQLGSFSMTISVIGFGANLTPAQNLVILLTFMSMFTGAGVVLNIMCAIGSYWLINAYKGHDHDYRTYIFTIICAVSSAMMYNFLSMALFIVASRQLRRNHTEVFGKENAFTQNGHLGFLRVIEVSCVLDLIGNVVVLVFVTRSGSYDAAYWVSFIQMLLMAVTLWFIWNRKEHGREVIIGLVAGYLVISLIVDMFTNVSLVTYVSSSIIPVVILLYFIFSPRTKVIFTEPFTKQNRQAALKEDEKLWNPKSLLFWRNLLLYFCIFSVVGHWMEWSVCWLIRWGIVPGEYDPNSGIWRDMLNPFFVYGAAMVFIGLLLFPLKNFLQEKLPGKVVPLLASFVVNTLFCAAIELAMGLVLNTPPDPVTGKLPLWDYTNMDFNFMGQICLLNTTFFGVMATLMTWLVYPNLERAFAKIPADVMNIITVVVVVFFILVVAMYVVNLSIPVTIEGMV